MRSEPELSDAAEEDGQRLERERAARTRLLDAGARDLPRRPWIHPRQPPSAVDLIGYVLWHARQYPEAVTDDDLAAALTMLEPARQEIAQLEAGLLFCCRERDMTWDRMARAQGFRSKQAAQQRSHRITGGSDGEGG